MVVKVRSCIEQTCRKRNNLLDLTFGRLVSPEIGEG